MQVEAPKPKSRSAPLPRVALPAPTKRRGSPVQAPPPWSARTLLLLSQGLPAEQQLRSLRAPPTLPRHLLASSLTLLKMPAPRSRMLALQEASDLERDCQRQG